MLLKRSAALGLLCFCALILTGLASCSTSADRGISASAVVQRSAPRTKPVDAPAGLRLPRPSEIPASPRSASTSDALELVGSATSPLITAQNVNQELTALDFNASYVPGGPVGGLALAAYEFTPFVSANDRVYKLHLDWGNEPPGGEFWLAMANFDTDRWDYYSGDGFNTNPNTPSSINFDFGPSQAYVDDVNLRCLAVLINTGASQARLEKLHVNNFDPVFVSADIPATGDTGVPVDFSAVATDADSLVVIYTWDFGDGSPPESGSAAALSHTYANPGIFTVSLSIADTDGGLPGLATTGQISISTPGNDSPTVTLTANGDENGVTGLRPLSVDFDAAANDTDGSITKFEWDFDADGIFEVDSGTTAQQTVLFTQLGTFDASVRVTDDQGGQAVDAVQISTEGGSWVEQPVFVNTGRLAVGTKMAIIGGRAAVAFQDMPPLADDSDIFYTHATTDDGDSAWSTPQAVEVDAAGSLFVPALAEVNGKPAVMYERASLSLVDYEQAQDAAGTMWAGTTQPVIAASTFQYSLKVVNGFPAASYGVTLGPGDSELRYRRATEADGTSAWGSEVTIDTDSGANIGTTSSLEIVNGLPAVIYCDNSNGRLLYKRSPDSNGDAWGAVEELSAAGSSTGIANQLLMIGANPASFFCRTSARVCYTRANSSSGDDWPVDPPAIEDTTFINATVFGGGVYQNLPCVAYLDFSNKKLLFLLAKDELGAEWNTPEIIAGYSASGIPEGSFLIVNGKPALAWNEASSDTIHYAIYK